MTARRAILIGPSLFVILVFGVPILLLFAESWRDFPREGDSGLDNFRWYFGSSTQLAVIGRTLTTALAVAVVCILLGFPFAYLMTIVSARTRSVLLLVVLVPFWTSLIIRTYVWIVLLSDNGPVNSLLGSTPLGRRQLLGTTGAVIVGMSQTMLPMMILPLWASISTIDRRLLDAAKSLGATPVRAFRQVYLPLAVPGLVSGASLVFILALGFYFTPQLLGSPSTSLISNQIVQQTRGQLAFGRGATISIVLLGLTLTLLAIAAVALRSHMTRALKGAGL